MELLNYALIKKRLVDIQNLKGKKVILRLDLNVPITENYQIADDTRIRKALPTIKYLRQHGAIVFIISHFKRPQGFDSSMSLKFMIPYLRECLEESIDFVDDIIAFCSTPPQYFKSSLYLFENIRFYEEEVKNDQAFSQMLASIGDLFVNDAFGTLHRKHSSTEGIAHILPSTMGLLVQKEIEMFSLALNKPQRPLVLIVGGAKVSTKLASLKTLVKLVDYILISGGMTYTFLKALGYCVGTSLIEEDLIDMVKDILTLAQQNNVQFILPTDVIISSEFGENGTIQEVSIDQIPENFMGLDIGSKTCELYRDIILKAKTVIWNGPAGVLEMKSFEKGSLSIARALKDVTDKGAITLIGGGESVLAIKKANINENGVSHISTGGGSVLELLEGKQLPGILALSDKNNQG